MPAPLFGGCPAGGAVAVFNVGDFRSMYPAFATDPPDLALQAMFDIATIYLRNDGTGPCKTVAVQTALLYMLTAHLTQLSYGPNGKGATGLVGRVASAGEGSVNVSLDYPSTPNNAWFVQTPYGANFWQATIAYRMIRGYTPGPTRFGTGIGAGGFPGGFFGGRR